MRRAGAAARPLCAAEAHGRRGRARHQLRGAWGEGHRVDHVRVALELALGHARLPRPAPPALNPPPPPPRQKRPVVPRPACHPPPQPPPRDTDFGLVWFGLVWFGVRARRGLIGRARLGRCWTPRARGTVNGSSVNGSTGVPARPRGSPPCPTRPSPPAPRGERVAFNGRDQKGFRV